MCCYRLQPKLNQWIKLKATSVSAVSQLLLGSLPLLLMAVSGRLWLSSIAVEGAMENRGGTVRQVVGRRKGM